MLQRADIPDVLRREQEADRRRRVVRIAALVVAGLAIAAGAGLTWAWWSGGTPLAYTTDAVARGNVVVVLTATGKLEPVQQIAVGSRVSGTIASVSVDFNQRVSKGQVLAQLDTANLETRLKRAIAMVDVQSASCDVASAAVSDAEAALRRASRLPEGQLVSIRDLELAATSLQRARANLAAAQAQLAAAEADLASARRDRDDATILAPIAGVVLEVDAEVGETITTAGLASPLFTIASDLHRLDLEVDIDEADVPRVAAGNAVRFTVEAWPDKPLAGVVRQVRTAPTITNGVISYTAVIAVDNPDLLLRPGMTATADITTDEAEGVLTLSNAALRFDPAKVPPASPFGAFVPRSTIEQRPSGDQQVHVLSNGEPRAVAVTTGRTDGQRSEILAGDVAEGDLLVTGVKDN